MNHLKGIILAALAALVLSAQFASPPTQGTICGQKGVTDNGVEYYVVCQDLTLLRRLGVPVVSDGWITQIFMFVPERADAVRVQVDRDRKELYAEQYTWVVQDHAGRWSAAVALDGLHYTIDEIAVFAKIR